MMTANSEDNSKKRKRRNSEIKFKQKQKEKQSTPNHQRTNSSPPDLYNGRCVAIDSSERSVNDWDNTRKDEYSQVVLRDINDNSLVAEDEREKSSHVSLDGSQTNSHSGKSDEDTGEEAHRVQRVKTKLGIWKTQATDLILDRLLDFVNDEPEETVDEYVEGEPLAVKTLKENINRFTAGMKPVTGFIKSFTNVFSWTNPAASFLIFLVYMYSVWHGYLLSLILFAMIWKLFINYLHAKGITKQLGFLYEAKDELTPSDDHSWSDKFQLVLQVARKVQNTLGKMADALEKVKNLLTWEHPEATRKLFTALCVALLASLVLRGKILFMIAGLFWGIKLFMINPIYHRYPKVKRRYDSTAKLWRELPTGAELAARPNEAEPSQQSFSRTSSSSSLSSLCTNSSSDQTVISTANLFSERFKIPSSETLLPGWEDGKRCTFLDREKTFSNVKQGRMFLTQSYLCFEKIKSSGTKNVIIKLEDIKNITKARPFGIMPGAGTALEVHVRGVDKPYIFGGLIGRDDVFDSITLQI